MQGMFDFIRVVVRVAAADPAAGDLATFVRHLDNEIDSLGTCHAPIDLVHDLR
jgi:hypothetical protein